MREAVQHSLFACYTASAKPTPKRRLGYRSKCSPLAGIIPLLILARRIAARRPVVLIRGHVLIGRLLLGIAALIVAALASGCRLVLMIRAIVGAWLLLRVVVAARRWRVVLIVHRRLVALVVLVVLVVLHVLAGGLIAALTSSRRSALRGQA